jgi:hypothetical protein
VSTLKFAPADGRAPSPAAILDMVCSNCRERSRGKGLDCAYRVFGAVCKAAGGVPEVLGES